MPNEATTHLLDANGRTLCTQGGPGVPAASLLQDPTAGLTQGPFCPVCCRAVICHVVGEINARRSVDRAAIQHERTDAHLLLEAIRSLATTPPGEEAAVMTIIDPAMHALGGYIAAAEGRHA